MLASLWHRVVHLTVHMNLYVPAVGTVAALLMARVRRLALGRPELMGIGIAVVGNALAFSVLGGRC